MGSTILPYMLLTNKTGGIERCLLGCAVQSLPDDETGDTRHTIGGKIKQKNYEDDEENEDAEDY